MKSPKHNGGKTMIFKCPICKGIGLTEDTVGHSSDCTNEANKE